MSQAHEKIRYQRLRLVCAKAAEQSVEKSLSLEQLKKCYPAIASSEEGVEALEIARTQIIDFWLASSAKEFDYIFQERELEAKLDALDEIIQTAQDRRRDQSMAPVQVDKLSPEQIIEANLQNKRESTIEALKLIYNQLCVDNQQLFDQLDNLLKESEDAKLDIDEALSSLNREIEILKTDKSNIRVDKLIDTIVYDDV